MQSNDNGHFGRGGGGPGVDIIPSLKFYISGLSHNFFAISYLIRTSFETNFIKFGTWFFLLLHITCIKCRYKEIFGGVGGYRCE